MAAADLPRVWCPRIDPEAMRAAGYLVIGFDELRQTAASARRAGARQGVANPLEGWLGRMRAARRVAITGARIDTRAELELLHGLVLAPGVALGVEVVVECAERLSGVEPERFTDPRFEYPYTYERAMDAAGRLWRGDLPAAATPAAPTPPAAPATPAAPAAARPRTPLDQGQLEAVTARGGVVQVIAPAGSGKTTVLIERIRELLRRGADPGKILALTFNRTAASELQQRLATAGVPLTRRPRTFHSIGMEILREEGLLRSGELRTLTLGQWRRLCAIASRDGGWIDPSVASSAISEVKLGGLVLPAELRRRQQEIPDGAAIARIYELYEADQRAQRTNDYDDLILLAVRALREDDAVRARWQARFEHVLVDEYQDIEPAQELLVRILAAPQDNLFCVGDEDQTLYGWRRASALRLIELDRAYPSVQRVALPRNYRCPADVVEASRNLIGHNAIRFAKPIEPARAATEEPAIGLRRHDGDERGAATVAARLATGTRGELVVLARTTRMLRTVALACAPRGIRLAAPPEVFEPRGAQAALEAYLRLGTAPANASADDIAQVCRTPGRSLPAEAEDQVAAALRGGATFAAAFAAVPAGDGPRGKLATGATLLERLGTITDAAAFIRHVRGPGGLDAHFEEHERTFAGTEQIEIEALDAAEREAAGMSARAYRDLAIRRTAQLRAIRDDADGIECCTIHTAKGREWPEVHVFAVEAGQLPHKRALEVSDEQLAAGEGLEAERRLAYVAFTRARRRLIIHTSDSSPSPFISEAGLAPPPAVPEQAGRAGRPPGSRPSGNPRTPAAGSPRGRPPSPQPPVRRAPGSSRGPASSLLAEARRVGLAYALRTAPNQRAAIACAMSVLARPGIESEITAARMQVGELLAAIETLSEPQRTAIIDAASVQPDVRIARLGSGARTRLLHALEQRAG